VVNNSRTPLKKNLVAWIEQVKMYCAMGLAKPMNS
jgi:hypothetical protein